MGDYEAEPNNKVINILIIVVGVAIAIVLLIMLFGKSSSDKLYCIANSTNDLPTNQDVEIHVYARGENATIEANGINTNNDYYKMTVTTNGKYQFYAVSGKSRKECYIDVNNIDKIPPTGTISLDTEERNLVVKLNINATDNMGLAEKPYSWDNKTWSKSNYLKVSRNGIYTCFIKDKAGNIGEVSYKVTNVGTMESVSMFTNTSLNLKVDEGTVKSWQSNNPNIATVDKSGKVTAKLAGTATVTATLTNGEIHEFVINVSKTKVTSISLNPSSTQIKPKGTVKLIISDISPSTATCDNVSWSSSNTRIVTVNNGLVTGVNEGSAEITANCDGITAKAKITVKGVEEPIVPTSSIIKKYESSTLKYYIQSKSNYYLTYIWMEEPYNQIKKLDSNTAVYGKVLTDSELSGKELKRRNVGEMVNSYISNGIIPKSKAAVAFNASGFYVKGTWNPPSDYYNYRSDSWLVLNEGIVTRNRQTDGAKTRIVIGITSAGNLKIYSDEPIRDEAGRKAMYNQVMADKVKNTFSFSPALIKNGKIVVTDQSGSHKRQGICQINSNNYVMLTVFTDSFGLVDMANILKPLGCQTAFNLDGGGSTSLFYKDANSTTSTKVKCSDGAGEYCRSIVEGIYFVEK